MAKHLGGAGDGDWCPQDEAHGRMFFMPKSGNQICTHAAHKGVYRYAFDGKTPLPMQGDTSAATLREKTEEVARRRENRLFREERKRVRELAKGIGV